MTATSCKSLSRCFDQESRPSLPLALSDRSSRVSVDMALAGQSATCIYRQRVYVSTTVHPLRPSAPCQVSHACHWYEPVALPSVPMPSNAALTCLAACCAFHAKAASCLLFKSAVAL